MNSKIRSMSPNDKAEITAMMETFYASPAVHTNGSLEIFSADFEACVNNNPYLEGFVIEENEIQGYAMVAKSFSTEFGKPCIWIEDLYIKKEYRGMGLGKMLLEFILSNYQDCIFRLEAEEENKRAVSLYKKCGFNVLPYLEMKK